MFSVNTWIIILCVAIYVIDGMLAPVWVTGEIFLVEGLQAPPQGTQVDLSTQTIHNSVPVAALLEPQTGLHVGWIEVFPMQPIASWLHFSTKRGFLQLQVWRLIGFQFLHATPSHLLFNMIGLYFFGSLIERYLGSKRYLAFYLLCGMCGALMYALLNLGGFILAEVLQQQIRIPGLLFNSPAVPLVGASAGVFGVLMAGAYIAPRATVLLFFFIPMQLRTLAYALVVVAFLSVLFNAQNAGGEAGHLGGAIAGWYFIRNPHHLHGFFDLLGRADPTSRHYRGRKGSSQSPTTQREVDRILQKISQQGIQSLTEKEKRILKDASRGQ